MKISIRKAIPGDGKAIMECITKSCKYNCDICNNKYSCNENFFLVANPELIDKKLSSKNNTTLIALYNDKVIGLSLYSINNFSKMQHRAECGWFVLERYSNNGVATRLVNMLIKYAKKSNLKRLDAEIAVNNKASLRVAEKNGFKIEGRKANALLLEDGTFEDVYVIGRLLF